jgi:hypothetical protein
VCGNTTTVTAFAVDFPSSSWSVGYFNWNGKVGDGAKLKNAASQVIDIVVATGTLFENADLVRIPSVTTPDSVYTPSQWTSTPVTLATNASPGSHNGSTVVNDGPRISNIVTDPAVPVAGSGVAVLSSVMDPAGALGSVSLAWGTSNASLANSIPMSLDSDSTYRTDALIPAHSNGATIYCKVQAVGAQASSASSLLSHTLGGGGTGAPAVLAVGEMSDSTLFRPDRGRSP